MDHFETLWQRYIKTLRRGGRSQGIKAKARKGYERAVKTVPQEDLDEALDRYIALCERDSLIGTPYVMQAQTWFNSGWQQEIEEDDSGEPLTDEQAEAMRKRGYTQNVVGQWVAVR